MIRSIIDTIMKQYERKTENRIFILLFLLLAIVSSCLIYFRLKEEPIQRNMDVTEEVSFSMSMVPDYNGVPYAEINGNVPFTTCEDTEEYIRFSELDELGRCGIAEAVIGEDLLAVNERGSIGQIKPSGWQTIRYDDLIPDKYLYNRCHLIAYELCNINDDARNLVTGTRSMNIYGMLPFENKTVQYMHDTGNHVYYRSVPVFQNEDLVCKGILLEAYSIEDNGEGLSFCVFCYNVQPGIEIDYQTGQSRRIDYQIEKENPLEKEYVLNKRSMKFHDPDCEGVLTMSENNKEIRIATREELLSEGYTPCGICNP